MRREPGSYPQDILVPVDPPMARLPRLHAPHAIQCLVQRAANGRLLVNDADDAVLLLRLVGEACRRHGFALHAYALTPSEFLLLGTAAGPAASAEVLQSIGRAYVPWINRKTGRSGALWERRYRSTIVDPELVLRVMQVVEATATNVGDGGHAWSWSSRAHHVGARQEALVTDHPSYWALSDTPFGRQAAYRALSESPPEAGFVDRMRHAIEHGWALGSPTFVEQLDQVANRRTMPLKRGRPRKAAIVGGVPN